MSQDGQGNGIEGGTAPTLPELSLNAECDAALGHHDHLGDGMFMNRGVISTGAEGAEHQGDTKGPAPVVTVEESPAGETPPTVPGQPVTPQPQQLQRVDAGSDDWNKLGPSEQNAIVQYAQHNRLDVSAVKLSDVAHSCEGLLHWASKNQNWGGRSPLTQKFGRAVKHHPNIEAMYGDLSEPLRKEFRCTWGLKRDFQFTKEVKTISISFSKSESDAGEFMTQFQMAIALGLAGYPMPCPERDQILQMADRYMTIARSFGVGKFYQRNEWLGAEQGNFIKRLVSTTCTKTWTQAVEDTVTVNLWEQRLKECKAMRNFAQAKGLGVDAVSVQDVGNSEEGLDFWADVKLTVNVALKAKAKAKAKPKCRPDPGAAPTAQQTEKSLKAALASEYESGKMYLELKADIEENPANYRWGDTYIAETNALYEQIEEIKKTRQFQDFAAATLSVEGMKKLKREQGEEFFPNLVRLVDSFKTKVQDLASSVEKV